RHRPASRIDETLRAGRLCYDHLAGRLGVQIAEALSARGDVVLGDDGGEVTERGLRFLAEFGIETRDPRWRRRRYFCRPCLDWSERRPHIAGALGAALAERCFAHGWIERVRDSRAVIITAQGRHGLARTFGIAAAAPAAER